MSSQGSQRAQIALSDSSWPWAQPFADQGWMELVVGPFLRSGSRII